MSKKPFRVYIGWDGRDALAFEVCRNSLLRHTSIPVEVIPLKLWELRRKGIYWRSSRTESNGQQIDDRDGKPFSTDFSFSRFAVPLLEDFGHEPVLFCDPDMLWLQDIKYLRDMAHSRYAVQCVQHDHTPPETEKMGGLKQTVYYRKNWSSLMLLHPFRCTGLGKYILNNQTGQYLQTMLWAPEEEIGALPEEWNWLEGWSDPNMAAKVAHFTRGTPDIPGTEDVRYAKEWWDETFKIQEGRAAPLPVPADEVAA